MPASRPKHRERTRRGAKARPNRRKQHLVSILRKRIRDLENELAAERAVDEMLESDDLPEEPEYEVGPAGEDPAEEASDG